MKIFYWFFESKKALGYCSFVPSTGTAMKSLFSLLCALACLTLVTCASGNSDIPAFTKQVDVFGIRIYATVTAPDERLLHAANVLAEFLDNDEDGIPDNPLVMEALLEKKAVLIMTKDSGEEWEAIHDDLHYVFPDGVYHDQFANETIPNAIEQGIFDGCWEETLHLITRLGYGNAYPAVFGLTSGTEIAAAVDLARGGHFEDVPDKYPEEAWYTYYDETCRYGCQINEYVYWALTSILGAQDIPGRLEQIGEEWPLNTREKLKEGDPAIYALLTDSKYKFPTVLPDGDYRAKEFMIVEKLFEIKVQEENYFPPEGRYPATVGFITECQAPGGEAVKIAFTISDEHKYGGRSLSLTTSIQLTLESELFKVLSQINPELKKLESIDGIDLTSVEGSSVWLTTEPIIGETGSVFPKIVKIESRD